MELLERQLRDMETDREESVGPEMSTDAVEHGRLGVGRHEREHVPGQKRRIEAFGFAMCGEIEVSEVGNDVPGPGVVHLGSFDENGIGVDAHDIVTAVMQGA